MKGLLILIGLMFSSILSFAQASNTFPETGNVGIGTMSPTTSLFISNANTNYATTVTLRNTANNIAARTGLTLENDIGKQTYFYKQASGNSDANDIVLYSVEGRTRIYTGGIERFVIENSGNIGIGVRNAGEKLSVNGNIRAREIKVENANWPDYVFAKDYQLPSLKETEQHIKERGHLQGMPSAEQVKLNGVDLGEMNAKLLQKIEELTLYLIEMKKENETERSKQQQRFERQEKDIEFLKSKIN